MSHTKILINTKSLTLEIEGHDDFVRTYLDKLLPIIERTNSQAENLANASESSEKTEASDSDATESIPALASKKTRHRVKNAGPSCREKLVALRDDGFFSEQRGIAEVNRELHMRGEGYSLNQVGAALSTMTKRNEIERSSVDGKFQYVWKG